MISGQMLGILNEIVSEIEYDDSENQVKEIHVGFIKEVFREYIDESKKREVTVLMCEINGIPVFANAKCGTMFFAVNRGESWKDHIPEQEVVIDGVKPSKTWIKNNLNIFKKKG